MTEAPLRRTVAGLGLATIVSYGGWFYGFGVLVQPISEDTGWSIATLGAAYAVGQLLAGLAGAAGGRLLDLHGGRTTFAVGALVGAPLLAVAAAAQTLTVFFVAFALGAGVVGGTGFYHVTMAAAQRLRPARPAKAIGPLTIWGAFASPLLLPLTAALLTPIGWRGTLAVLAAITGAGMLVAAALAPGGRADAPIAAEDRTPLVVAARDAWGTVQGRRLVVMVVGNGFGTGLLLTYQVPMMVAFGLPLGTAATVAGARGLLQLTGRIGLDGIVERVGARQALLVSMFLSIAACVLMVWSGTLWVAALFALVAGAAIGAKSPLTGIYASQVLPAGHLGALMGAVMAAAGAATAAGPLIGGILRTTTGSYVPALILAVGGFAVAALALTQPTPVRVLQDS